MDEPLGVPTGVIIGVAAAIVIFTCLCLLRCCCCATSRPPTTSSAHDSTIPPPVPDAIAHTSIDVELPPHPYARYEHDLPPRLPLVVASAPTADSNDRAALAVNFQLPSPSPVPSPPRSPSHVLAALTDDPIIVASRLPFDTISTHTLVGTGGFGEVYKGTYRGMVVAIKKLLPEKRRDLGSIIAFLNETKLIATLEHENIVQFIGVAWDALRDVSVVTEFMGGGDLRTLLTQFDEVDRRPKGFDDQKILIAINIANALTYIHSLSTPVLHRDLKSKNILLEESQWVAKLADFGESRERRNGFGNTSTAMTGGVGTVLWMAPEVMRGDRYDAKADVFSFGVVMAELDTHLVPYTDVRMRLQAERGRALPDTVLLQRIMTGVDCVTFSSSLRPELRRLSLSCVSPSPRDRPTAAQVHYELQVIARAMGAL